MTKLSSNLCWDMYYRKLFLHYWEPIEGMPPLADQHLLNLKTFVHDWLDNQKVRHLPNTLQAASKKETQKEIAALEKKWGENHGTGIDEKDDDLFVVIAWSKFRYVLARKSLNSTLKVSSIRFR